MPIGIAAVPAIVVVVGHRIEIDPVHDGADARRAAVLELEDRMVRPHAVRDAVTDHEQHAVHVRQQHQGIADAEHGRGIHDHVGIEAARFGQEIHERPAAQQLGGMVRNAAGGQQIQLRDAGRRQGLLPANVAGERLGQTGRLPRQLEDFRQRGPAQIGAHQQRPATVLSQADGQIGCHQRFAFARTGAGDHQHGRLENVALQQEAGAQGAERLRDFAALLEMGNQPALPHGFLGHQRHGGQHGQAEHAFDLFVAAEPMVGVVGQEDRAEPEDQPEGQSPRHGLAGPRPKGRFGGASLFGQADDVGRQGFGDAGFLHPRDDGLVDLLVGFDVALEFVVAHQLAIQLEGRLFLLLQRRLEIEFALDQHFVVVFQRQERLIAGLLELLLQLQLQFDRLLEIRVLLAVALAQAGRFALLVPQPLARGLDVGRTQQRRDLGGGLARPDLLLDGLPLRLRLDALGLGRRQRAVERLELFDDDVLVFLEGNRTGPFAVFLELQQAFFQLLAIFFRALAQPIDGLHGHAHAVVEILLDVGLGDGVGQGGGELRIRMLDDDVDHPAFLDGGNGDEPLRRLDFFVRGSAGQEPRILGQAAARQRLGHHVAAVEGVDVRVEILQVPGVVGQDVLVVQDLGDLRLDQQRRRAAVIGRLAAGLEKEKQEHGDGDQAAQPGAFHQDGDAFAPIGKLGQVAVRPIRIAGDVGSLVHRRRRPPFVRKTPGAP